jgi:hypothetical protein
LAFSGRCTLSLSTFGGMKHRSRLHARGRSRALPCR